MPCAKAPMIFRRIIILSLMISVIIALAIIPIVTIMYRLSLPEMIEIFGFLFSTIFAIALVTAAMETQLHKGKPYRDLFILIAVSLALALGASAQSLTTSAATNIFLPFDFLFILTMTRSYQLMLKYQATNMKSQPKVRDLPLPDQILIAIHFIGFFVFVGLAVYYLGWYPA